jgi:hypothetical protein
MDEKYKKLFKKVIEDIEDIDKETIRINFIYYLLDKIKDKNLRLSILKKIKLI